MRVVGLTGGIATGKSTVGHILRELGVLVIDADQVARDIVQPGQPALTEIVDRFGASVLAADGTLDRPAMRQRMTSDPQARRALEAITHPRIQQQIAATIAQFMALGHKAAVVEAALLVETGSYRHYPVIIVVSCTPQRQLARLMARDGATEEEARQIISTQLPLSDKERVATHIIRNDGSTEDLEIRTREVWQDIVSYKDA